MGTTSDGVVKRRTSGLSVTLKRSEVRGDEKVLEEQVMVNKSSFSNLLQRHAQWKSPTALKVKDVDVFETTTTSTEINLNDSTPSKDISRASSQSKERASALDTKTPKLIPSVSKSSQSQPDSSIDLTFQEVSSQEAVPAIKPSTTTTAIPASQPSEPSQPSPNLLTPFEPRASPPIIRSRHRNRKRDLVISDSEDESSTVAKRQKLGISPRAAMKSAPSSRAPITKPAQLKLPMMSGDKSRARKSATKGASLMARKSASVVSGSRSPTEERAEFIASGVKDVDRTTTTTATSSLRSPVSPVQSAGIDRILRRRSPLPSVRPNDPGQSLQYSIRLLLTHNSVDDTALVPEAAPPGYYSTPYPVSLSRPRPPRAPSPVGKRSRSKTGFNIVSLVPNDAVPVLEDGKLAFREGSYDIRTGHLKRGARKFKVGKIVPGDVL